MIAQSKAHLAATGEGYLEHFRFASTVGLLAMAAGLACLIHALVPALCTRTCSRTVAMLSELFADRGKLSSVRERSDHVLAFIQLLMLGAIVVAPLWLLDAPQALRLLYTGLALALPATLLLTNRELESES